MFELGSSELKVSSLTAKPIPISRENKKTMVCRSAAYYTNFYEFIIYRFVIMDQISWHVKITKKVLLNEAPSGGKRFNINDFLLFKNLASSKRTPHTHLIMASI